MDRTWAAMVLICLIVVPVEADPTFEVTSGGLQVRIPDGGYTLIGFHFSVNKPLDGVAAGDYGVDITTKTGNEFVYTWPQVQLHPGDKVNYWYLYIQNGLGYNVLGKSWTYAQTTATTTTRKTTHTTRATTTQAAVVHQTAGSAGQGGQPVTSGGTSGGSGGTGINTNTGGGGGTCSCQQGPGKGDGFVDSSQCTSFPCLVFEDNFDFINHRVWQHEITAGGGGNWEFQFYTNNRTNSYTRDGILYIKPTLTSDHYGMEFLEHGSLDLWGGSVADVCTGNNFWGCKRDGAPGRVVNPIQSARLRSSRGFNFRYGKVEVEAQLPIGDWLWPAIWMLPTQNVYGNWPASGEIDIMESRGNRNYRSPQGVSVGVDSVGSTLHFGADYFTNQWPKAHAEKVISGATYADGFHKYAVNWDDEAITFYVDDEEILRVDPGPDGFWKFSGLDQTTYDNPWKEGTRMAPFDQEFHIILNLAVGGVGYFDDKNVNSPYAKPWVDNAGSEADRFWAARSQWLPTWNLDQNNGEDAALKINYVKVWKTKTDQ